MSSTEPPGGSVPPDPSVPPAGSTPPPPTPPPTEPAGAPPPPPPPAGGSSVPPPPPPAGAPTGAAYGAGAPGAYGPGSPGNLLDRFLARVIDGLIVGIPAGIIQFIFQAAIGYWVGMFLGGVVTAILGLAYFGYLDSSRGQTVGKQVMKLKVVGPDGHSNPTMAESIKRNIWYAFDIVPCLGPIASLVSIIVIAVNINSDPERQHFFDKFAGGTRVLKVA